MGITQTANTYSEERQQQLDAFTIQPREEKRKRNMVYHVPVARADGNMEAQERKEVDSCL